VPLVFSNATFAELADVLMRPKFDRYVSRQARVNFLKSWRAGAIFVPDVSLAEIVTDCRDPKDNKFLELALAAGVRVIVSGDPDLLSLDPWRGVRVVELSRFEEVVLPIIDQAGA
jgi:putative PIN family toxin of toxin-antitoxin system